MEKLQANARRLDIFFRIVEIVFCVAAVASLVGLVLIGICFLFKLDPEMIGSGYNSLDLGVIEMELADGFAPDQHRVLGIVAAELAAAVVSALLGRAGAGRVRALLAPMKQGMPFHAAAAGELKRLALLSLILGVVLNISEGVNLLLTGRVYGLSELMTGDKIRHITLNFDADLNFLLISGVLLLLSYIFRYGQELQRLSDETL